MKICGVSLSVAVVLAACAPAGCHECGRQPAIREVQGVETCKPLPSPGSVAGALNAGRAAVERALDVGGKSWGRDGACARSYTWDVSLMINALMATGRTGEAQRHIKLLVKRQNSDGGWPVMRLTCSSKKGDLETGATETAAVLGTLGTALNMGVVPVGGPADRALEKGLVWLKRRWQKNGALSIMHDSCHTSTESTAMAIMAGLTLGKKCTFCEGRAKAAVELLTRTLWRGDHFAAGADPCTGQVDDTQVGPHTHQGMAVLALWQATKRFGSAAPNPASYDPLPWLKKWFSRAQTSAGRTVKGIGDQLVLQDTAGVLYGCQGGKVAGNRASPSLVCPRGAARRLEPVSGVQCHSPFGSTTCGWNTRPRSRAAPSTLPRGRPWPRGRTTMCRGCPSPRCPAPAARPPADGC